MGQIKVNPEGWEEMVQKYHERQEEAIKEYTEKRGTPPSTEKTKDVMKETWARRNIGPTSEYTPLKDKTVIREPTDPEIQQEKRKVAEDLRKTEDIFAKQLPHIAKNVYNSRAEGEVTKKDRKKAAE